jgi:hypothetical protein
MIEGREYLKDRVEQRKLSMLDSVPISFDEGRDDSMPPDQDANT